MKKDDKSKPVVHSPPDDPLGIDPDKDFDAEARRIARDAIERRHEKPSRWKLEPRFADGGSNRSWSPRPWKYSIAHLTSIPTPGDEIADRIN